MKLKILLFILLALGLALRKPIRSTQPWRLAIRSAMSR